MRGALDLSSHRLDAWVTSFATKRLKSMRQKDPAGVYLGGYGWVEDLQPGPPRTEVTPPPGEPGPVFAFRNDPGFVHAPSLEHAATVAVLRSGHLTRWPHAGSAGRSAGDRSVVRTRPHRAIPAGWCAIRPAARRLAGVSLRARPARAWARRLHRCVPHIAPIKSARVDETGQPVEFVSATHVVDGLDLVRQTKVPADRVTLLQFASRWRRVPVPPS